MTTKFTSQGVTISREMLHNCDEVRIRQEGNTIVIVPIQKTDSIYGLGQEPVTANIRDASTNHGEYLTSN